MLERVYIHNTQLDAEIDDDALDHQGEKSDLENLSTDKDMYLVSNLL